MADIKLLINRFENAVHSGAEGDYRELSHVAMQRRADAVREARQQLESAIEALQQRVLQLETDADTKAGYL